jgi:hypothetical protein
METKCVSYNGRDRQEGIANRHGHAAKNEVGNRGLQYIHSLTEPTLAPGINDTATIDEERSPIPENTGKATFRGKLISLLSECPF